MYPLLVYYSTHTFQIQEYNLPPQLTPRWAMWLYLRQNYRQPGIQDEIHLFEFKNII